MKVRDLLKKLENDGWLLKNQEGSHRHYIQTKIGKVTLAGRPGADVPVGRQRPS